MLYATFSLIAGSNASALAPDPTTDTPRFFAPDVLIWCLHLNRLEGRRQRGESRDGAPLDIAPRLDARAALRITTQAPQN